MMSSMEDKLRFWKNHWQQWKKSSVTQPEYCKLAGISIHVFRRYSGTFSKHEKRSKKSPSKFILIPENKILTTSKVKIKTEPSIPDTKMKLYLSEKIFLEIPDTFNKETLLKILKVVEVV